MSVLKIRGEDGVVREVVSLKGEGGLASTTVVKNGENIRIPHGGGQSAPLGNNVQNALENLADAFYGPYLYTDSAMQTNEQFNAQTFCNALKGKAEGELVTLRDVSPVRHNVGVAVNRKNLLSVGTVVVNEFKEFVRRTDTPLPAGTYTFSTTVTESTDTDDTRCFVCWELLDGGATGQLFDRNKRVSVTFTTSLPIKYLAVYAGVNYASSIGDTATYEDCQLEEGSVATPFSPFVSDPSVAKLQVLGKNWFSSSLSFGGLSGVGGGEFSTTDYVLTDFIEVKPNTTYILSGGDIIPPDYAGRHAYDKDKNWIGAMGRIQSNTGVWMNNCFTTPPNTAYIRLHFAHADKTTGFTQEQVDALNATEIQMEIGTTATAYEPYTFTEYEQYEAISSISPNMTVTTDTPGALVSVEYNRDINAAFETLTKAIISLGGNV